MPGIDVITSGTKSYGIGFRRKYGKNKNTKNRFA